VSRLEPSCFAHDDSVTCPRCGHLSSVEARTLGEIVFRNTSLKMGAAVFLAREIVGVYARNREVTENESATKSQPATVHARVTEEFVHAESEAELNEAHGVLVTRNQAISGERLGRSISRLCDHHEWSCKALDDAAIELGRAQGDASATRSQLALMTRLRDEASARFTQLEEQVARGTRHGRLRQSRLHTRPPMQPMRRDRRVQRQPSGLVAVRSTSLVVRPAQEQQHGQASRRVAWRP